MTISLIYNYFRFCKYEGISMKKFKIIIAVIFAVAVIMGVSACSNSSNSGGGGSSSSDNPFDGTSWYGDTKDKKDVKLLEFVTAEYNGNTYYRCKNVEDLYFGEGNQSTLIKGQALNYSVEKKSDGSYVATTQIFKYSVVIPSADSTTGYISIERNNQTLKININKK